LPLFFYARFAILGFMSIDTIEQRLKGKLSMAPSINATVKLDFGDEGILFIDATQTPPVITREDKEADVTFICASTLLEKIMDGTQDPTMAYMMGKLKIKGSMGLAMKLNAVLED